MDFPYFSLVYPIFFPIFHGARLWLASEPGRPSRATGFFTSTSGEPRTPGPKQWTCGDFYRKTIEKPGWNDVTWQIWWRKMQIRAQNLGRAQICRSQSGPKKDSASCFRKENQFVGFNFHKQYKGLDLKHQYWTHPFKVFMISTGMRVMKSQSWTIHLGWSECHVSKVAP